MAVFNIAILLLLSIGCVSKIDNNSPTIDVAFFETCKLSQDSIRMNIQQGQKIAIQTDKGVVNLEFSSISKICYGEVCGFCDPSTDIVLTLSNENTSYKLPRFSISPCSKIPVINPAPKCNDPATKDGGNWALSYGKLIFGIVELTPYPQTKIDLQEAYDKKLFKLNLFIINSCK